MHKSDSRAQGSVLTIALIVIIVVVSVITAFAAVAYLDRRSATTAPETASGEQSAESTVPSGDEGSLDALRRNQVNTQRKADAAVLATRVAEYMANNSGQLPGAFQSGQLTGGGASTTPAPVKLGHYKNVEVVQGAQDPVTTDAMRLVLRATCGSTNSVTVEAGATNPRSYVVQYSLQNADGGFDPQCMAT